MTRPEPGRHALVVVTSTYSDDGLGALRAPVNDAAGLAEVLGDPAIGDFDVEVLSDPTAQHARLAVEDFFADRSTKDTLLLHFSCHGVKNAAGKLFLAATDTLRTRLAATGIPAEYVSGLMLESRAQRAVLLLDCCYAGAFERGMLARGAAEAEVQENFQSLKATAGKRGRAVFTASSAVEYAFEGDHPVPGTPGSGGGGPGPSLFTGALVEGLRTGEADLDNDGEVGMSELADYVSERIRLVTPHQTPQLWLFGSQGDLSIAHTGRPRPRPANLPPPLADAVRSESRERKLWAVEDLGTLLCGPDVGVALTAHTALSELAADDSRRVADRATHALARAAPVVDTWALEVGPTETAVVKVMGPPLVLATLEAKTEPWLKVRYVDGGIELAPDVAAQGRYAGTVQLRTVSGELAIAVATEVKAEPEPEPEPEPTPVAETAAETAAVPETGTSGTQEQNGTPLPVAEPRAHRVRQEPARPSGLHEATGTPRTRATGTPRLSQWPFPLAAVAMVWALCVPFYENLEPPTDRHTMWLVAPMEWIWPMGAAGPVLFVLTVLSAVTCATAGVMVRGRFPALGRPVLRWWCGALAALTLGAMVTVSFIASVVAGRFDPLAGCLAFAVGSLLQACGAAQLWPQRSSAGTGPPQPTDPRSLLPFRLSAPVLGLVLPLPLIRGDPDWRLIEGLHPDSSRSPAACALALLGLIACVVVGFEAWRGVPVARLPKVRWWYSGLTLLTLGTSLYFWNHENPAASGLYVLTFGCALQLWASATLWLAGPSPGRTAAIRGRATVAGHPPTVPRASPGR
ncbi:caspase domain-containing protein [Streptomyces sp. NPDC059949]|uniref:caspase family protein n=1 Tax=Streptomyces sp. NPDC059949 TaxID=3347013 RepID=UPI0036507577